MQISSGVLRIRYHLYNAIIQLEEKIVNIENDLNNFLNENSEEYLELSRCLEYSNENLRKQIRLYNFLSENSTNRFIDLKKVVSFIVVLKEASIIDKVECLCYLFNKNYEFFMDDRNLKHYVKCNLYKTEEECNKDFFDYQTAYKVLREYITEDNKVTQMQEFTYEEFQKFKDVGFTKKATGVLIDTALRNYEYGIIYEKKRELKI